MNEPKKEEKDKESIQEMLTTFLKRLWGRDTVVIFAAIGAIAYVTLKSRDSMAQSAQVQIDAGIAPTAKAVDVLTERFEQHLKDDAEAKRADAQWKSEMAADNRALYKAVMTGERQYRLERPLPVTPDGGP